MRIERVEAFDIPRDSADHGSEPSSWTSLRVVTDDGVAGWGEGPPMAADAWAADVRALATLVEGVDPRGHEALLQRLRKSASVRMATKAPLLAALDIALHDLVARSLDVPAYDLLGGLYRERIPVYAALRGLDPLGSDPDETSLDSAAANAIASGFRTIKVRIAGGKGATMRQDWIDASVRLVSRVRSQVGRDIGVIVDIGESSNTAAIVRLARALEDHSITWLELGGLAPLSLRSVADQTRVRLCHGAPLDRHGLLPYLEAHSADIVAVSPAVAGLAESRRVTDLASHFDAMSCAADAVGPLGLLANVQSCAAMPGYEMMGVDMVAWEAVLNVSETPLIVADGELIVPDTPGIGASIREERLVPHERA